MAVEVKPAFSLDVNREEIGIGKRRNQLLFICSLPDVIDVPRPAASRLQLDRDPRPVFKQLHVGDGSRHVAVDLVDPVSSEEVGNGEERKRDVVGPNARGDDASQVLEARLLDFPWRASESSGLLPIEIVEHNNRMAKV